MGSDSEQRHEQVTKIFLDACELGPQERERFLDLACGGDSALRAEVESMLSHDWNNDLVSRLRQSFSTADLPEQRLERGTLIGPYKILRELGRGGMGVAYLADQQKPVRRQVALKLIKWGMDTEQVIARFQAERQALALMNHPNIARVFDAGATPEGRPFFAMEFVDGVPITRYCDQNRLTTAERLDLFRQVCEGVQHAHQKGIIHRDLKPSNILVTLIDGNPVPKIIDFGVAKATSQRLTENTIFTELGQLVGTPEYMSPEQADLAVVDIDTRTDVYSLGVVLYELLAGALPFESSRLRQAGFDEIRRIIREEEPPKPSTKISGSGAASDEWARSRRTNAGSLARQLSGDLDWITLKALDKAPNRRYASPGELAADIERHLRHEPVFASPPSAAYRVRKFVRRHRMGTAVTTAVALLVGGFSIVMTVQASRIARERDRANAEAEVANQVSRFLVDVFDVSDPWEPEGATLTARELLHRGAERIDSELGDQPLVRARLMATIGWIYERLGLYEEARPLIEGALEIRRQRLSGDHPDLAASLHDLAYLNQETQGGEVRSLYERALEIQEAALGPDDPAVAFTLANLASACRGDGDAGLALRLLERAVAIHEKTGHPDLWKSLNDYAIQLHALGDLDRAVATYERSIAMLDPDHPGVAWRMINAANIYRETGRLEKARRYYDHAIPLVEQAFGEGHTYLALSLENDGLLHRRLGDCEGAREKFARALAIQESNFGAGSSWVAQSLALLGGLEIECGELEQGKQHYREAIGIMAESRGEDDPSVTLLRAGYYAMLGESDSAFRHLRRAVDLGSLDVSISRDPDLDAIRDDPRFQAILTEIRQRMVEH